MAKKNWSDLTSSQRRLVFLAAALETAATTVAARDLARRPASGVRGSRAVWAIALVIQPVGPLAYLATGRKSV